MLIMNEINKESFNVHNTTAFSIKKGSLCSLVVVILFLILHLQAHSVSGRIS